MIKNANNLIEEKKDFCLSGPLWLPHKDNWPTQDKVDTQKSLELQILTCMSPQDKSFTTEHDAFNAVGLDKYSNFKTLTRIIALVLSFINKCKKRQSENTSFTAVELDRAQVIFFRITQQQ